MLKNWNARHEKYLVYSSLSFFDGLSDNKIEKVFKKKTLESHTAGYERERTENG